MMPEQRKFTGMETTLLYVCPACDAKVEFQSLSQAGVRLSVGLMGLVLRTGVFITDVASWGFINYLIYGGVLLVLAYVLASPLLPYWAHPVTGAQQITESDLSFDSAGFANNFSDVMQRSIIKFERHGFWRGFVTPLVFIVVVLGVAAAIGMVGHYLL